MLLAASTALCRDRDSYRRIRGYMIVLAGSLTAVHVLVAFTPLFDWIVVSLIGVPEQIVEPSRIGLRILTPWTGAIAYRRFNQGVLIRFGQSKAVSIGTSLRLLVDVTLLGAGYWIGSTPGIVVATTAVSAGVICEAFFIRRQVRPVLATVLPEEASSREPLSLGSFLHFYVPLALTSLLNLAIQPASSAAISRMPHPLESLAAWPVVYGLLFMLRCLGHAFQEVAVALLDHPGSFPALRRFVRLLAGSTTTLLLLISATPLSGIWFEKVAGLEPELAVLARTGIWFGLLLPALSAFQNWFQGILVQRRQTRGVTEAVIVFLFACVGSLLLGVWWGRFDGLCVGFASFSLGGLAQTGWLWWRSGSQRGRNRGPSPVPQTVS